MKHNKKTYKNWCFASRTPVASLRLSSRVTASFPARFDCKVGCDRKHEISVYSTWKFGVCSRARLCCQIEQGSLQSLEKPDSVISSSSFVGSLSVLALIKCNIFESALIVCTFKQCLVFLTNSYCKFFSNLDQTGQANAW